MDSSIYSRLKETAFRTAGVIGPPSFYVQYRKELELSSSYISGNGMIHKCKTYLDESKLHPAHGISHCAKVALEAGAIVQIESRLQGRQDSDIEKMILSVQIAGLLHDIKRNEKDHTIAGSIEAENILKDFDLQDHYKRYITAAIRNHEAFKDVIASEDEDAKLISDSLYDADKFRWGPDNFTTTLWLIIESTGTTVDMLYRVFEEKMEWIRRIKNTFRTGTGRRYGPEFIDMGILIGNKIYGEMKNIMEG